MLREVSAPFGRLAEELCLNLPRNPERSVALRKLLEAKDAAVRAALFVEPASNVAPIGVTRTQPEVEPEGELEAQPEVEPEAQPEGELEAQPEVEPEVELQLSAPAVPPGFTR